MDDTSRGVLHVATDGSSNGRLAAGSLIAQTKMIAQMRESSRKEGWAWSSTEELLLALAGDPVVLDTLRLPRGVKAGQPGDCFANAFRLSQSEPARFYYAEGLAYAGAFVTSHAWCIDRTTGAIVDPTWAGLTLSEINTERPAAYLGLAFDHHFHAEWVHHAANPSIIEDGWRREGRILREGLRQDEHGLVIGWGNKSASAVASSSEGAAHLDDAGETSTGPGTARTTDHTVEQGSTP